MNAKELNDFFKEVRERDDKLRKHFYEQNHFENLRALQCKLADTDD